MIPQLNKPMPGSAQQCGRVAVLMGGESEEREVSLENGDAVYQALLAAGLEMPDLVLSIVAATLTGEKVHAQVS